MHQCRLKKTNIETGLAKLNYTDMVAGQANLKTMACSPFLNLLSK